MFEFDLPAHLIAQHPAKRRDQSRLMVVDRHSGSVSHRIFAELPDLLAPGDLLILNDTRVLPARLLGQRERTGGKWEGLFLRETDDGCWEMLCQTRGKLQPGEWIHVEGGSLRLELIAKNEDGSWRLRPKGEVATLDLLQRFGHVPLPPYIRKGIAGDADVQRYQTVYAHHPGAVAAPTAGLHFTEEVFRQLNEKGVEKAFVTLHVGWGTFQPLTTADITQHKMHHEWGQLPVATVAAIDACRRRGGRVIAVGTTAVRVLESAARSGEALQPWSGETGLFIYPPYEFRVVDAMITNFHLPRTTLLLLVGALAGVELLQRAYTIAIEEEYRFYSYGDAMLIV